MNYVWYLESGAIISCQIIVTDIMNGEKKEWNGVNSIKLTC